MADVVLVDEVEVVEVGGTSGGVAPERRDVTDSILTSRLAAGDILVLTFMFSA